MPLPVLVIGAIKIAGYGWAAYEIYSTGKDLYKSTRGYKADLKAAEEKLKSMIKDYQKSIAKNIDQKKEVQFLIQSAKLDKQSATTKKGTGRGTKGKYSGPLIKAAIAQKIPFRSIVGEVCQQANDMPLLNLRKKKGKKLSQQLEKSKLKTLANLASLTVEEIADVDLNDFIVVRLKQLSANFLFETVDKILHWRSSLKPEVCFGANPDKDKFRDPIIEGGTKLKRVGSINPFFPMPVKGSSVSADLIIPDYRKKPLRLNNIFAIIEIKFPKDTIKELQFKHYKALAIDSGNTKISQRVVSLPSGSTPRVSLFRYPEDLPPDPDGEEKKKKKKKKSRSNANR